jgi:hypothetical protein
VTGIVADRSSPQKHVWRAGIVLATAEGLGVARAKGIQPRRRIFPSRLSAIWRS